ncbi:pteridine reductase [Elongatibacter sediminis]
MSRATKTSGKALVTGSAARIGRSIAQALHGRGLDIMIHCNSNQDGAGELEAELNRERTGSACVVSADLTRADELDRLCAACREWCGGRLDLLVNNASRFYPTAVGETQGYQWDDLLDSNLRGPYFLSQGLLPALRPAGGAIVNIVDVHAERPMKGHAVYCIAKAGLRMMTLALARELGPEVRVNGVSPGAILWPEAETDERAREDILARTALKRTGEPDDIASAVAWLALDAPYVTGQIVAVDGGRLLNI